MHSFLDHCHDTSVRMMLQGSFFPFLLPPSVADMILELKGKKEEVDSDGCSLIQSSELAGEHGGYNDDVKESSQQYSSQFDCCEHDYQNEDEYLNVEDNLSDSEEEEEGEESEEDDEAEEEDDFIQFSDTCISMCLSSFQDPLPLPPAAPLSSPLLQPPCIKHISSFSSEESGYCENTTSPDCSEGEQEEEDPNGSCNFDEGLWHMFEKQAFFPSQHTCRSKTFTETQGHLNPRQTRTSRNEASSEVTGGENVRRSSGAVHRSRSEDSKDSSLHPSKQAAHVPTLFPDSNYCSQKGTKKETRHVWFKPDNQLEEVHCIIAWQYAYRSARKGFWEHYALDRDRFRNRIDSVARVVEPCLRQKLLVGNTCRYAK